LVAGWQFVLYSSSGETTSWDLWWRSVNASASPLADYNVTRDGRRFAVATLEQPRFIQIVRPWVFHRDGKPIKSYDGAWRSACRKAGVPGRTAHDFRRTTVRRLEQAGGSQSVAMKLTGHKTESVYRRYAIVSKSDLEDAVRRLDSASQKTEGQLKDMVPVQVG